MPRESGTYADGKNDCGDFTQGLIELGATVCVPNGAPNCTACPMRDRCVAYRDGTWDRLPVKSKKPARRVERRTVLLLTDGERFGLVKREEKGLLAGLFEPINLEGALSDDEILARLADLGIDTETVLSVTPIGEAKHIFTHVEWQMAGRLVRLGSLSHRARIAFVTVPEIDAEYAVPSAFRYFVHYMHSMTERRGETV